MSNLDQISTEDIVKELERRNVTVLRDSTCPTCHKWSVKNMVWSSHIPGLHCEGCLKPITRCTC
jgi:hypothetical protein